MSQPAPAAQPIDPSAVQSETFRLSADCQGIIYQHDGKYVGCLRWESNHVGPFSSLIGARMAVRTEFVTAIAPRDVPIVRGL